MSHRRLLIPGICFLLTLACLSPMAAATAPGLIPYTVTEQTFFSIGSQDGYVVEDGTIDAGSTSLRVGDENGYPPTPQIVSILSFDTSPLPDDAVINSVQLILKQESSIIGEGNPFVKFQGLLIDAEFGSFGSPALELEDYWAAADLSSFGPYTPDLADTYTFKLGDAVYPYINKWPVHHGLTQFRLRFTLKSDGNARPDYIHFYSGDELTITSRPQLVVRYHWPSRVGIASR